MPDTYSITIMAHPIRMDQAERLSELVDAEIIWDEKNDQLDTQDRAWGYHDHDLDWSVVLEDDAVPSAWMDTLGDVLERAREINPRSIVSLYVGTARPLNKRVTIATSKADSLGAGWLTYESLMWNVGVAIPTYLVGNMLNYVRDVSLPADQRISRWARNCNVQVLYPWPSLVDHDDGRSLLRNGRGSIRVARRTGPQLSRNICVPI